MSRGGGAAAVGGVDSRLRTIAPRYQWGFTPLPVLESSQSSILLLNDNEYLLPVGSLLTIYNDNEDSKPQVITPQVSDCIGVQSMVLSPDNQFLAIVFIASPKRRDPTPQALMYIYDVASQYTAPKKPRTVLFAPTAKTLAAAQVQEHQHHQHHNQQHHHQQEAMTSLYFVSIAFSHDGLYLACSTNMPALGVQLYDAVLLDLLLTIPTASLVTSVSFNPSDSRKICTLGYENLFQMWRVSEEGKSSVHPSPIHGLDDKNEHIVFKCIAWLEGGENRVLVGSDQGSILLVQGCDQLQTPTYAFGLPGQPNRLDSGVVNILVKGDYVVAVSEANCLSMFEIKRFSASGAHSATAVLIPIARYRMMDVSHLVGMQWCLKYNLSSFLTVIATTSGIFYFDLKCESLGSRAGFEQGKAPVKTGAISDLRGSMDARIPLEWTEMYTDRPMTNFHSSSVHSLALSARTSSFVTASCFDESVRIRDFASPSGPCLVTTTFSDRRDMIPNHVDMHPSGQFVACACEDDAVEFVVTDASIETIKRLPTKIPFTLPNGTPFVNTQPVSLVRYSHTGHLLAIVTGKVAQVFHMFRLKINQSDLSGTPTAIMVLMDHTAPITDLVFSHDDSRLYTSSSDGCVYQWTVGANHRSFDFTFKDVPASKLAVSEGGLVVACYDENYLANSGPGGSSAKRSTMRRNVSTANSSNKSTAPSSPAVGMHRANTSVGHSNNPLIAQSRKKLSGRSASFAGDARASFSGEGGVGGAIATAFGAIEGGDALQESKKFLVYWQGDVSVNGEIVQLEAAATSIALGAIDAPTKTDVCVIGLADGRVLISVLPFPLRTCAPPGNTLTLTPPTAAAAAPAGKPHTPSEHFAAESGGGGDHSKMLDESLCKILQLHKSAVTGVVVALSGLWIFSSGADGAVFMLSTSLRARDIPEIPESTLALENTFVVTEKEKLATLRSRIADVDNVIFETKRDSERAISKLTDQNISVTTELSDRMKRELQKRDVIIVNGREDLIRATRELNEQLTELKRNQAREISELESLYERKLSQEGLYLEKMRQAYDEYVLHSRMDMSDFREEVEREKRAIAEKHNADLEDFEKQKSTLLLYIEYANARNQEVLASLDEKQDEERHRLKKAVSESHKMIEDSHQAGRSELASLMNTVQKLKLELGGKEDDIMRLNTDLGWATERIKRLDDTLKDAALELKRKAEACDKWEFKVGDQQQQIHELERIRKALTSQLHELRKELGPKEEKLSSLNEKLQEVDREYELSLQAISDKEQVLGQRAANLVLLQKQVRELRTTSSRREASLRRAAKLFDEYKLTLKEATFNSYKKTVPAGTLERSGQNDDGEILEEQTGNSGPRGSGHGHGGGTEIIEIIARSSAMEASLKRLDELLLPFSKGLTGQVGLDVDSVAVQEERDRQISLMHKSVNSLKKNLDSVDEVAAAKVKSHLSDNKILIEEVNSMRQQVRNLSLENQRLKAKIEFSDMIRNKSGSQDSMSSANMIVPKANAASSSAVPVPATSLSNRNHVVDGVNGNFVLGSRNEEFSRSINASIDITDSIELPRSAQKHQMARGSWSRGSDNGGSGEGRNVSSRDGARNNSAARARAADAKIGALFQENEEYLSTLRASNSAAEILSFYQQQLVSNGNRGGAIEKESEQKSRKEETKRSKAIQSKRVQVPINISLTTPSSPKQSLPKLRA